MSTNVLEPRVPSTRGRARATLALIDHDPELGQLLDAERLEQARRELVVRVLTIGAGEWGAATRLAGADPGHVGLLMLQGLMSREVVVSDHVSAELLGPGDIVRPWGLGSDAQLLQSEVRWMILAPSRVALLDRDLAVRLGRYPEVNTVLIDRMSDRAQRLATTQAICQLNRVDRRLLALFWFLAERWGRVSPDGVTVPLVLSHRMLAQLVGARRPTVSTALGDLARRGELLRRADGTWLLTGDPVGVPTGEAARVIRQRRAALPAAEPAEPAPAAPAAAAVPPPELAEMREKLHELRQSSAARSEDLSELVRTTAEIQARTVELRHRRREQRERPHLARLP